MQTTRSIRCVTAGLSLAALLLFEACRPASGPAGPPPPPPVPDSPHRITVVHLGGGPTLPEFSARSVADGLELFQFEEDTHFALDAIDLGGNPDGASAAIDQAARDGSAVLVISHPQVLSAALAASPADIPIVFGILGDAVALGAGEADDRHRPGLTGAYNPLPSTRLLSLVTFYLPDAERVGVVFDPDDPLSVAHKEAIVQASSPDRPEVVPFESVDDLLAGSVDAVCLVAGSPSETLDRAAEANLPVFGFGEPQVRQGAVAAEVPRVDRLGVEVGRLVYRVLEGEAPEVIPFSRVLDVEAVVNLGVVEALGIPLPTGALRISRPIGGNAPASSD